MKDQLVFFGKKYRKKFQLSMDVCHINNILKGIIYTI